MAEDQSLDMLDDLDDRFDAFTNIYFQPCSLSRNNGYTKVSTTQNFRNASLLYDETNEETKNDADDMYRSMEI